MDADLSSKAESLGRALAATPEFSRLREAEELLQQDPSTMELIERLNREVRKIQHVEAMGMEIPPSAIEEVENLRRELDGRATFTALIERKEEFDLVFAEVIDKIEDTLEASRGGKIIVPSSPIVLPNQGPPAP